MSHILTAVPCKWVVNIADRYPAAEIGRCHRSRFCHEKGPVVLLTETPRTRLGAIFNHLAYLLPNGQRWIRQTRIQPWSANRNSERRLAERAEARNENKKQTCKKKQATNKYAPWSARRHGRRRCLSLSFNGTLGCVFPRRVSLSPLFNPSCTSFVCWCSSV